jgi:hypothetical protein
VYAGEQPKRLHTTFRTRRKLEIKIIHLYGEETTRHIRLLENLQIKKTKLLASLTFYDAEIKTPSLAFYSSVTT